RKHGAQWSRIVIWASGLATVVAILGITVGMWMFSPAKRYINSGAPARIPYAGQKRWHSILGLIFGLLACSWAFSGMLSMDPFPRLQGETWDSLGSRMSEALRVSSIHPADFTVGPQEALARLGSDFRAKELEFV